MAALDRRLSKVQLKETYDVAAEMGLDASAFQVSEALCEHIYLVTEFQHSETRAFLRFGWTGGQYRNGFILEWWPSHDGKNPTAVVDTWREALEHFARWLVLVKNEIATPDVWTIAREQRKWLTSTEAAFTGNTPFTSLEMETIAHHLRTIEEFTVKTYQLHASQAADVHQQLGYLTEAAHRVGRFD